MNKPSSRVRIRASRANGALSRGPKSEAGRRACAAARALHGYYSTAVVLPHESQVDFDALLELHLADLQPANHLESLAVTEIAAAEWRLRRARIFCGTVLAWFQSPEQVSSILPLTNSSAASHIRFEDRYRRDLHNALQSFTDARSRKK